MSDNESSPSSPDQSPEPCCDFAASVQVCVLNKNHLGRHYWDAQSSPCNKSMFPPAAGFRGQRYKCAVVGALTWYQRDHSSSVR